MKNFEVAKQFDLMADLLELRGENPFLAWVQAARARSRSAKARSG